jgi:hypothetical protein
VTTAELRTAVCPVDGCGQLFDLTVAPVADNALAEIFGFGVMAAVDRNRQITEHEQTRANHFAEHQLADFVASLHKANKRLAESESTCEDLHDRLVKLARRLDPQPGDLVKGWIDEGGSAQGILLNDEEAKAASEWPELPSYYAVLKLSPAGNTVMVMRESLKGVEL